MIKMLTLLIAMTTLDDGEVTSDLCRFKLKEFS